MQEAFLLYNFLSGESVFNSGGANVPKSIRGTRDFVPQARQVANNGKGFGGFYFWKYLNVRKQKAMGDGMYPIMDMEDMTTRGNLTVTTK